MKKGDTMDEKIEEIEKTSLYSIDDFEDSLVSTTLKEVCLALKEKGYNEIKENHSRRVGFCTSKET